MEPSEKLAIAENAFLLRVYHHGIPQDSSDPILRLTHCDILPRFRSSELGKRDPVRRFQREPVCAARAMMADTQRDTTMITIAGIFYFSSQTSRFSYLQ